MNLRSASFFYLEIPRVCGSKLSGIWHSSQGQSVSLHDLDEAGELLFNGDFTFEDRIHCLGQNGKFFAAVNGDNNNVLNIVSENGLMTSKLAFEAKKMALLREDLLLILGINKHFGAAYASKLSSKSKPKFIEIESGLPKDLCFKSRIDIVDDYGFVSQVRGEFCQECDTFHSCAMLHTLKSPKTENDGLSLLQRLNPEKLKSMGVNLCHSNRFVKYT